MPGWVAERREGDFFPVAWIYIGWILIWLSACRFFCGNFFKIFPAPWRIVSGKKIMPVFYPGFL
jgi:hypothetical protein